MPQNPHFCPLEKSNAKAREGDALEHMVTFSNLVEATCKFQLDDPPISDFKETLKALAELESHESFTTLETMMHIQQVSLTMGSDGEESERSRKAMRNFFRGCVLKITLWDNIANQVPNDISMDKESPSLMIVTSTVVKEFKGFAPFFFSGFRRLFGGGGVLWFRGACSWLGGLDCCRWCWRNCFTCGDGLVVMNRGVEAWIALLCWVVGVGVVVAGGVIAYCCPVDFGLAEHAHGIEGLVLDYGALVFRDWYCLDVVTGCGCWVKVACPSLRLKIEDDTRYINIVAFDNEAEILTKATTKVLYELYNKVRGIGVNAISPKEMPLEVKESNNTEVTVWTIHYPRSTAEAISVVERVVDERRESASGSVHSLAGFFKFISRVQGGYFKIN
ncbi:hypothetical protein GIB67_019047 [Kingdonia uniflora]|uniref:Uncharacterized protein n=1 Tax=Kingdonia uniflora TaxID=39325 RepID=A0A7J7N012_9MAGN|nr:hypothetical protein GIB67_019047 [Kingdonia uniflora]